MIFRSIGESESENMHLARLWREGSPERQLVALSAELRRSGLLLKNTRDSPSPSIGITKKYIWFAASGKKIRISLFLLAILLHAILDAVAVLTAGRGIPLLVVELIIWGMAAVYIIIARKMWKNYSR